MLLSIYIALVGICKGHCDYTVNVPTSNLTEPKECLRLLELYSTTSPEYFWDCAINDKDPSP